MKQLLFFSYGVTKSGSTLAFEFTKAALAQAGYDQPRLQCGAMIVSRKVNAVEHLDDTQADALLAAAAQVGHPIVLKTHTRPDPAVIRLLSSGRAQAHAVVRDPRDVALSMIDHGRRSRENGRPAFAEIHTLDDAMQGISNQFEQLTEWLTLPGVRLLRYDDLAFDSELAVRDILDHLGIDGDPLEIADSVLRSSFTQFNKGIRDRHRTEMSDADSARFRMRFAPFYNRLLNEPAPPLPLGAGFRMETALGEASAA